MCNKTNDFYEYSSNHIINTVCKIDKLQKEITADYNSCISCETSLVTSANNTIPVAFTTCAGPFEAVLAFPDTPTGYFRIESIRDKKFVTLRLLEPTTVDDTQTLTASNQTCILNLDCVCSIQCFTPITVTPCITSSTNINQAQN